ncbi:MAG: MATE family efflux transporter [Bacillota bacterium]
MQEGHRVKDFTTGSIMKHLLEFSTPLFLGNLLQALYNTVDSIWVGRFLGPQALGAVSLSFPIVFTLISLAIGLSLATTVLVSQYFGAGDRDSLNKTMYTSITFIGLLGIGMSFLGLGTHRLLLRLVNAPADVMPQAAGYLAIFSSGLVFTFLYNVLGAIYRGLGDSRTPVTVLVYATIMNMILDPMMIFGVFPFPAMGVAGAAWATVASQAFSVVLLLRWLRSVGVPLGADRESTSRLLNVSRPIVRSILRIGLPAGAQQALVSLSGMAVIWIVNSFGSTVLAAYGAGVRLDQFALMPSMSISMAVSAIVGQNIGAGKPERVREAVILASELGVAIAAVIAGLALFKPGLLMAPFTRDARVLAEGAGYLRIVGVSYIPFALMFVTNGAIRGAGDTIPTMFNTLAALWLVRVPLAWILSRMPALGSRGIWIAIASAQFVGMTLSRIYYASGKWKKRAVATRLSEELPPVGP